MAARKPKTEPEPEPVEQEPTDEQCPATNDDGTRCLFVVHEEGEHAFTEEAAEEAGGPAEATDTDEAPEEAPEGNGEPSEAIVPDPLPPLRQSENTWWCGKPDCDTGMGHDVSVCSTCGTPRG